MRLAFERESHKKSRLERKVNMVWEIFGQKISKIGIVGSGNIGPDIALYFSKVLHKQGVPVVVVDIAESALKTGEARVKGKFGKELNYFSGPQQPDSGAITEGSPGYRAPNGPKTAKKGRKRGVIGPLPPQGR